ncbi:hypothetical protein T8K17_23730 [Thalassobaculum sp. OXR-137]|uniref:hypothetical protein n=1 Tax=Thalassobaculum sp. OXR-137 TaxID=3100173 RepID=UPI002AC99D99|nr:hypothetical protein [Thalassobaculum sp. OXR-137]WPZ34229.1 hypothetical protein T8K17_23730 [Thalassobaculum sp. OXR-137]
MTHNDFAAAFEALTLPPSEFRHAGHVRLAWIYLTRMSLPDAMTRYASSLRAFAGHVGKPGLFHETITYAFLMVINERIADGPDAESWEDFQARNPDVMAGVTAALGRYYSDERLGSDRARAGFVMPDRLAG